MTLAILAGTFVATILLGFPVAWCLGLAATAVIFSGAFPLPPAWLAQQLYQGLDSVSLAAIPLFLFAGGIMNEGGLTQRIIAVAEGCFGWMRGGLGPVNVATSMIYGGISGSATADTGAVGAIMIPAMAKRGYPRPFAAAVTAASGTLGIIIPPSVVMIMYGVITNTSIGGLFVAGIIPGVLLGLAMMLTAWAVGVREGYPKSERAFSLTATLRDIWRALPALMMPVIVLGSLMGGFATVTEAALVSVIWALGVSLFYRELSLRALLDVAFETIRTAGAIMIVMAVAVPFAWLLTVTQVPRDVAMFMLGTVSAPWLMTLVILVLLLFVGLWLDTGPALIILAPIIHPIALKMGMDPFQIGLIFTLGLGIGLFTPPVGTNLFVVCNVGRVSLLELTRAIVPFWLCALLVLIAIAFVPGLTAWLPRLLGY